MKVLFSKNKNFDKTLDNLLFKRRKKIISDKVSVTKIINDVKNNGDKALIKYEKRFNKNNKIVPSLKKINRLIKSLDPKVKKAIDIAYNRIYKFHSLQKLISFQKSIYELDLTSKGLSKKNFWDDVDRMIISLTKN